MVDYYLHLLPGVRFRHARRRLTLLSCHDASELPLTQKILERPRLLGRIWSAIPDPDTAHITCFNSTPLERTLAVKLDIPLYTNDPALAHLGSKSGGREVFREARAGSCYLSRPRRNSVLAQVFYGKKREAMLKRKDWLAF